MIVLWLDRPPGSLFAQTWFTDAFLPSTTAASADSAQIPGLLRIGPIIVDVDSTAEIEHTDNVNFSPVAQPGTELSAGIGFNAAWQALQAAQFKISGAWEMNKWITGPGPNQATFTVTPGSTLRYSIYVETIQLTPFVNLKRTYDPGLAPTVGDTAIFEQSSYDVGLQLAVPLHNLNLEFMGLRGLNTSSGSGGVANIDTDRRLASARLVREFNSRLQGGVEYYALAENFKNAPAEGSTSETARVFSMAQLTATLHLVVALGVEEVNYTQPAMAGDSTRDSQPIADLELSDFLRENLSCALQVSDQVADNYSTDYYRTLSVGLSVAFKFNQWMSLSAAANWQHIVESSLTQGSGDVWDNRAHLQVTVSDKLSLHLDAGILSNQVAAAGQGYSQKRLELGASRRF